MFYRYDIFNISCDVTIQKTHLTPYMGRGEFDFYIEKGYFLHVAGANNNSIGNNSKRPANISKIKTILEGIEKNAKLPAGPTLLSPGPTLLIVAATAVKLVTRSCPSKEISKRDATNKNTYATT